MTDSVRVAVKAQIRAMYDWGLDDGLVDQFVRIHAKYTHAFLRALIENGPDEEMKDKNYMVQAVRPPYSFTSEAYNLLLDVATRLEQLSKGEE